VVPGEGENGDIFDEIQILVEMIEQWLGWVD
jgi:hypothetical protein